MQLSHMLSCVCPCSLAVTCASHLTGQPFRGTPTLRQAPLQLQALQVPCQLGIRLSSGPHCSLLWGRGSRESLPGRQTLPGFRGKWEYSLLAGLTDRCLLWL